MRIHVTLKDDQVICWFDLDRDDGGFDEKRDCAISFYDEVVRFLVDRFGEEFKYEDPRISADYIDRNNMYGQYDIVLDDDGENAPVIAIWENEENTMKRKSLKKKSFDEGFMSNIGKDGQHLYSIMYRADGWDGSVQEYGKTEEDAIQAATAKGKLDGDEDIVKIVDLGKRGEYLESSRKLAKEDANGTELTEDAILNAIPVDARDGLIDINEPDGSFGRYTWYVKFAPFSDEEANEAADGIKEVTGRRTQVAGFGKEIYVLIMDYPSRPTSESKKLAKEAGRKVIPAANGCSIHDMGDCLIVTNKMGLNIGQCRTMIEAEVIADEADERTKERCLSAGHDREWEMYQKMSESRKLIKENDDMEKEFVCKGVSITRYDYESLPDPMAASQLDDETMQKIACDIYDYLSSANWSDEEISKYLGSHLDDVLDDDWKGDEIKDEFWRYMEKAAIENGMKYYEDMPEGEYADESSRKLVKEGAGAGYTVTIKDLKLGSILDKKYVKTKKDYESYWECQVEVMPGEYEIEASDYYNDFFWQEHEFGETPKAKIDGGVATIEYSTNSYDEEEAEDELRREISNMELDISFSYSRGWMHSDLPRENMKFTDVDVNEKAFYGSITQLELIAPDLADAVNSGYASIFDRDEEEGEVPMDESTGAAKINLTWDEFNKLCDLIDMDWKRWNKNNAKSIPLVADRAVEHLEWITNKRLKGLDPKTVTISYTIPGSGIDEYDTGTQNTQTIYELIEGMAWDNYNPYNESDYAPLGRGKPRKTKDVIVKVDVEWAGMDSEDDDEQYLDDVGLPGSVYINIPFESYADGELDYDLRTKLGNTFDGYVEDYTYHRVEPRAVPKGVPIYIWRPETDIMEEF